MSRAGREYPDRPWVGVGVVVWQGDRVLLIRRGRAPRLGQWGLPGGAQSVGETLFEAAAREVLEQVRAAGPDEVEVKFGVKVTGTMTWVVAKAATEGNFEVTLKWQRGSGSA